MHPLLLKIGPIPIHTYGFMIAIGFICAMSLVKRLAARAGLDPERMMDLSFWCLVMGFAGCRVLFIITQLPQFLADPLAVFRVWEGGLVFFGGPLVAVPFGIWYTRKYKMSFINAMDCILPGLVLGHMFGRFGCLGAGCCYGKPTEMPWGIRLNSELVDASMRGIPLHPTQLYEASALFILLLGLLWVFKHRKFQGQVSLTYFMAYPIIRSIIEIYRGDTVRGFVIQDVLSTSQFISILVFLAAFTALVVRMRKGNLIESKAKTR